MKETLIDLKERRSCRAYLDKQVEKNALDAILEAGTYAPTGRGRQTPLIVAVQDKAVRDRLSALNAKVGGYTTDPFYGAPTVLVVLSDPEINTYLYDGALVMGNLLNAAHAVGVDSCYIFRAKEVFEMEEGKALLREWGIPERYEGIGNCILGYRDPDAENAFRPLLPRKPDYVRYI